MYDVALRGVICGETHSKQGHRGMPRGFAIFFFKLLQKLNLEREIDSARLKILIFYPGKRL